MAESLAIIKNRVDRIEELADKHDQDLYRGNGKPGITLRIASNEKDIKDVNDTVKEIKSDLKKVVWLVLAAVIGEILKLILVKGH